MILVLHAVWLCQHGWSPKSNLPLPRKMNKYTVKAKDKKLIMDHTCNHRGECGSG